VGVNPKAMEGEKVDSGSVLSIRKGKFKCELNAWWRAAGDKRKDVNGKRVPGECCKRGFPSEKTPMITGAP